MGHVSIYLYGNKDNVFWKTMLDDSKSSSVVNTALELKIQVKNLRKKKSFHELQKQKKKKKNISKLIHDFLWQLRYICISIHK